MGNDTLRINSLVGLLNNHAPATLDDLRERHPNFTEELRPGTVLGSGSRTDEKESNGARQTDSTALYLEVALQGLETARARIQPNLRRLRARLGRARTIRFVGHVVAAVTSAGLLTAVLSESSQNTRIATAVLNFVAVGSALAAGYLEKAPHGGGGDMINLFESLVKTEVQALQLSAELRVLQKTGGAEELVLRKVSAANELAATLLEAEHTLWGNTTSVGAASN